MTDNRKLDGPVKYDFDFDEAMERIAQTNPNEVAELADSAGEVDSIDALIDQFEAAGFDNGNGDKIWGARDLASLLGYSDYRNFLAIVDKAKAACEGVGLSPVDHFVNVTDMIVVGKGARREVENIHLDRYACYLIAQNGDGRKRLTCTPTCYQSEIESSC